MHIKAKSILMLIILQKAFTKSNLKSEKMLVHSKVYLMCFTQYYYYSDRKLAITFILRDYEVNVLVSIQS